MKAHSAVLASVAVIVLFTVVPSVEARGRKSASTQPGTYKEWGPDIDEITIKKTFKIADYNTIVVTPFDTSKTTKPGKDEDSDQVVKNVLDGFSGTLSEAMRDELKASAKVEQHSKAPKASRTLIVRGTVEEIDPGSRAARYWGGFGAGGAQTRISGEIVDASTGAVLVKFEQSRRSGGVTKFGGGNDKQVMRDSIHALGEDIAHMLDAF
ncbi:MAG: hypothetical protein QOI24_1680 [Acidobacteriota bacterium]|jgi:hypothetical protein|nr:hypothetical protein [Acidobacteriota bacterium]